MKQTFLKLGEGGRIVIPAEVRKELDIDIGDELILHVDQGRMVLLSRKQAIHYVQEQIAGYQAGDSLPSDELIAERRKEAGNE